MAKARRARKRASKFRRLSNEITGEYERKGFSRRRARYIGNATAGKVARRKRRRSR